MWGESFRLAPQLVRQGEQARKQGDFDEAFDLFNQALKLYWDVASTLGSYAPAGLLLRRCARRLRQPQCGSLHQHRVHTGQRRLARQ